MTAAAVALVGLLLLAPLAAGAQAVGPPPDEPYPVELVVGDTFNVCLSGEIICPAIAPICDDPKVAVPVGTPDGLGFKGIAPGTTLCSAAAGGMGRTGPRRVFRITVR